MRIIAISAASVFAFALGILNAKGLHADFVLLLFALLAVVALAPFRSIGFAWLGSFMNALAFKTGFELTPHPPGMFDEPRFNVLLSGCSIVITTVVVGTIAVLGVLVAELYVRRIAARKMAASVGQPMCGNCGYDMRYNVSGKCPECGHTGESLTESIDVRGQPDG